MKPRTTIWTIVTGGTIAGALDMLFAISFAGYNGMAPARLLQTVASGALGNAAFSGGASAAAIGLACHFALSYAWAGIFVAAARAAPVLMRRPVLSGIAFGVIVFFTMRLVVLPLSAFPFPVRFKPLASILDLMSHMFLFGVPIAVAASGSVLPDNSSTPVAGAMKVLNIHERELSAGPGEVGALIDALASANDRLWPSAAWPALRLDRPLGVGAAGGHGPISYVVEQYRPGQMVKFRFTGPRGFNGHHWLDLQARGEHGTLLRHTIDMRIAGAALLSWPLVVRPLHDALLEDALALAQASLGSVPLVRPWSRWVKLLRWAMSSGRARGQQTPATSMSRPAN